MAVLKIKTFQELIEKLKLSDNNNFISDDTGIVSFSELADKVKNNINLLLSNIGTGKRFMLYAVHSNSFVEIFLSLTGSGSIVIPVNRNLPAEKIESLKNRFKIDYLIKDDSDFRKILSGSKEYKNINIEVKASDPVIALFTSGSTGEPKAVLMSHHNIFNNAYSVIETMELENPENISITLPLYHSFALVTQLITTLISGGRIFFSGEFKFYAEMIDFINKNKINTIAGVPTNFKLLLMGNKNTFETVKHITIAGAALDLNLADDIKRFFVNADLWIGYGLTEAGPRVTAIKDSDPLFFAGSVGKAISGVKIKLENNELLVKSPSNMIGYLDDPESTIRKITDNILHSGDLARIDENGYLYITGRKDDIFMSGGEKISPLEIEKVLNQFPDIQFSAVFGEDDSFFGKKIIALVKPRDESNIKTKELLFHCSKLLDKHLIPHKFFKIENVPLTPNGKIKRMELHQCQKEKL